MQPENGSNTSLHNEIQQQKSSSCVCVCLFCPLGRFDSLFVSRSDLIDSPTGFMLLVLSSNSFNTLYIIVSPDTFRLFLVTLVY